MISANSTTDAAEKAVPLAVALSAFAIVAAVPEYVRPGRAMFARREQFVDRQHARAQVADGYPRRSIERSRTLERAVIARSFGAIGY